MRAEQRELGWLNEAGGWQRGLGAEAGGGGEQAGDSGGLQEQQRRRPPRAAAAAVQQGPACWGAGRRCAHLALRMRLLIWLPVPTAYQPTCGAAPRRDQREHAAGGAARHLRPPTPPAAPGACSPNPFLAPSRGSSQVRAHLPLCAALRAGGRRAVLQRGPVVLWALRVQLDGRRGGGVQPAQLRLRLPQHLAQAGRDHQIEAHKAADGVACRARRRAVE